MADKKTNISFDPARLDLILKARNIISIKQRTDFLKACGCSYDNYKAWKRRKTISEADLHALSRYLNITIDYLKGMDLRWCTTDQKPESGLYDIAENGKIIRPYKKGRSVYEMQQNLKRSEDLFDAWFYTRDLFHFVNETLLSQGKEPIQKKAFDAFLDIYGITYESKAFMFLCDEMAKDIQRRRDYEKKKAGLE